MKNDYIRGLLGAMRLEDAISVTPYIRSEAEHVRGMQGMRG